MRTVREKDPTYFGMTAHSGAGEYVMRASIDRDIATLRLSGIDDTTLVYIVDNLKDSDITEVDSFCTKLYVAQRANIADLAYATKISEKIVLESIVNTITKVVSYLKQLQDQHAQ